jgi:AcrR family transcriptional regulator
MKQDDTRLKLIDGTIHVIARDGLDKATTKQISIETSTNEVYIYRCFSDKEDMFAKTFEYLDDELVNKALQHIPVMYVKEIEYEARCWMFFTSVWKFILSNRDKCLTYIRYYYSPYFKQYSEVDHNRRYKPLVDKFKNAFRDEANVWMILNHILNVMLDFAVKVFDGAVQDNADTTEHVFRLIYCSIQQYFRKKEC